jgi:SSS family transporter
LPLLSQVSQWTWAATLLQSSNVAWKYGVSGPFWYAAGATIQVLLFAVLAIQIKRLAPSAHTILEVVDARWGKTAHITFLVFCFLTNIIVTAMLILGGAAVVEALTGVNIYAAAFLIPVGVIIYTAAGGLKATFIASYVHTGIIYIVLLIFVFMVYATHDDLGSPAIVYEWLGKVASPDIHPVEFNKEGSYLTMWSRNGLIFGIINIVGNFGTVFVDQSYWQSAIAAQPSATWKGYILGGLCWFAIPFTLATSLGLASRALDLPLTPDEAGSGLVPPAAAVHLMGTGGAILILLQLFMAVTSTGSAEQIAVASLVAYDIYRHYVNPKATGQQIINVSRWVILAYGILSGILAVVLLAIGLNLGWVYLAMGVIIGSAVFPISLSLTWAKCSATAAVCGAVFGQWLGIISWILIALGQTGEVTVDTLGGDYPMLGGNLVSILSSGLICVVVSFLKPQNYDFDQLHKSITMVENDGSEKLADEGEDSADGLKVALKRVCIYGSILSLVLILVWPLLALPAGVFNLGYFTFWVIIAIIWGIVASALMIILPVWESWTGIVLITSHLFSGQKNDPDAYDSVHGGNKAPTEEEAPKTDV